MPYKDGTGPEGKGPMTGRGKGDCETTTEVKKKVTIKEPMKWPSQEPKKK